MKFIDLFAGIGGIRMAFERVGEECVFSSEWNRFAQQTYAANFGETPHGDIRSIASASLADVPWAVLVALLADRTDSCRQNAVHCVRSQPTADRLRITIPLSIHVQAHSTT